MVLVALGWREEVAALWKFQLRYNECDCIVVKFSKEKCGISVVNEIKDFWYWIDLLSANTR